MLEYCCIGMQAFFYRDDNEYPEPVSVISLDLRTLPNTSSTRRPVVIGGILEVRFTALFWHKISLLKRKMHILGLQIIDPKTLRLRQVMLLLISRVCKTLQLEVGGHCCCICPYPSGEVVLDVFQGDELVQLFSCGCHGTVSRPRKPVLCLGECSKLRNLLVISIQLRSSTSF